MRHRHYEPAPQSDLLTMQTGLDVRMEAQVNVSEDDRQGFEITGAHVNFFGVCRRCKNERWRVFYAAAAYP